MKLGEIKEDIMLAAFGPPMDYEAESKNNIAYWLPMLKRIGMRVPETIIIDTGTCDLTPMLDGQKPEGMDSFLARLKSAINEIGLPCFLRSGMTSNKHDWKNSCFLTDPGDLHKHLHSIIEHSVMANISGLPLDFSMWAVRKIIPTKPIFYDFNDMPITKERRLFIRGGNVLCNHPYWPSDCFNCWHDPNDISYLQAVTIGETEELTAMAQYVGKYFPGYWSVDFLQDTVGAWWLTDMAVGERSYHYPGCANRKDQP